ECTFPALVSPQQLVDARRRLITAWRNHYVPRIIYIVRARIEAYVMFAISGSLRPWQVTSVTCFARKSEGRVELAPAGAVVLETPCPWSAWGATERLQEQANWEARSNDRMLRPLRLGGDSPGLREFRGERSDCDRRVLSGQCAPALKCRSSDSE